MADPVLVGGSIIDMAGVARAEYVPASRLDAFHDVGMGASPSWSVFCVDGSIAFTPELGVVGDNRIRIDRANLREVEDDISWAPGDLYLQHGDPSPMCGRARLASVVAETEQAGLTARVGAELECTLLAADGGHASSGAWAPYGLRTSLERSALLVDLTRAAERAGRGIEQVHMEYGQDQLEVSLSPTDPVSAADDVVLARIVIGRAAARQGTAHPVPDSDDYVTPVPGVGRRFISQITSNDVVVEHLPNSKHGVTTFSVGDADGGPFDPDQRVRALVSDFGDPRARRIVTGPRRDGVTS